MGGSQSRGGEGNDVENEESATLRIAECSFDLRNDADVAQKAGRDGHDLVEVLHLEPVSVLCNQRTVVVRRKRRPGVECGVEYVEFNVVHAEVKELGHVKAIGRMPKCTGRLAIDRHQGRLMDGRVVVGAVSYTHLDVYKRQTNTSAGRHPHCDVHG